MVRSRFGLCIVLVFSLLVVGCELLQSSGTAKSDGGRQQVAPPSSTFDAPPQALRRAALQVLDEQGYVYEVDAATGIIRTAPKILTDPRSPGGTGEEFSASLFVIVEGSTVTYAAKFDRKSNPAAGDQSVENPELEHALRTKFFAALDAKMLSAKPARQDDSPPAPGLAATEQTTQTEVRQEADVEPMPVAEMQTQLLVHGYKPGKVDGLIGKRTVNALKRFQKDRGLPVTGRLDVESVISLRKERSP